ncbi:hypothetical protein IID23_04570, partial [Patescibacteria group bacterium]|nr:hypothetical protein [Patescibacteria group bacterium]
TLGTISTGTWNGTALTDGFVSDTLTIDGTGSVNWTALTGYPASCAAGEFVRAVSDSLTCVAESGGVPTTRTLTAGDGLSGGGDLSADRTFDVNAGSGIQILADAVVLGDLTSDWTQTGAFDIILDNADSQIQILESVGGAFYGAIDVGNLTADRAYTFPDTNGTICISGGTCDASSLGTFTASQFLRSDTSNNFTSGILTTDAGTTLDVNGTLAWGGATISEALNMNNQLITDIGDAGTYFVAGGGLTLAGTLTVNDTATFNTDVDFVFGSLPAENTENFLISATNGGNPGNINIVEIDFTSNITTNGNEEHVLAINVLGVGTLAELNDASDSIIDIVLKELFTDTFTLQYQTGLRILTEGTGTNGATLANGILIQGAAVGPITDGLDVSDSNIINAINLGANNVAFTTPTFDFDSGSDQITFDASTIPSTLSGSGVLDIDVTSATSANRGIDLNYSFGDALAGYGFYQTITKTANAFGVDSLYGQFMNFDDTTSAGGVNINYAYYVDMDVTGDTSAQKNAYGFFASVLNDNTSTDQGVRNTYGGYFDALGSTRGTSTAYGIWAEATGADTNYAGYFSGDVTITGDITVEGTGTHDFEGTLVIDAPSGAKTERLCQTGGGTGDGVALNEATIGDCSAAGQADFAEYYGSDGTLVAGDLVSIDTNKGAVGVETTVGLGSKAWVEKSGSDYDRNLIGVVSTNPFTEILSEGVFDPEENPVPIALNGRVPVKVSTENGPINPGDPLTSSSTSGVAMRATNSGPIVGKALESYDEEGVGKIIVFISVGWYVEPLEMSNYESQMSNNLTNLSLETLTANTLILGDNQITLDESGNLMIDGNLVLTGNLSADSISTGILLLGDQSSGTGSIPAGSISASISNTNIKPDSKIIVTLNSDWAPASRYWVEKQNGKFITKFDKPVSSRVNFDWIVIGVKDN